MVSPLKDMRKCFQTQSIIHSISAKFKKLNKKGVVIVFQYFILIIYFILQVHYYWPGVMHTIVNTQADKRSRYW